MTTINDTFELPNKLKLKNRLVKAAMTEGLSDEYHGATDRLVNLYKTWAENANLGMLITGNVQIDRRFLERPGNVCIDMDYGDLVEKQMEKLKEWAVACKTDDTKVVVQISHAGRQASAQVAAKSIGASEKPVNGTGLGVVTKVDAATVDQIKHMVKKFGYTAHICEEAGFDGVQIHAAHGYQASAFLNPLVNTRTDDYGGNAENRARFLMEIIEEVKSTTTPGFTICVKLNSADFQKGGFSVEEASEVCKNLVQAGVHMIELSGGNYESFAMMDSNVSKKEIPKHQSTANREAYFVEFAEVIRKNLKEKELNVPIMVTGGFRTKKAMDAALAGGATDLIGVGRPLCVDTGCTKALLAGDIEELPRPEKYWHLPSVLGWSFLQRFKTFYQMRTGTQLLTMYQNIFDIADGTFKTQSNKKHPNLITTFRGIQKHQKQKVATLRGYDKDDEFLLPSVREAQVEKKTE